VSTFTTLPAIPWRIGGTASMRFLSSTRDSGVSNSLTIAALTPTSSRAMPAAVMIVARRESRMVLAKMLPKP
jgi:hypothetical protein